MDKFIKHKKHRKNQRVRKAEIHEERYVNTPIREPMYQPPQFRGFKIEGNLDFGYLKLVFISLWDAGRIDSYYVRREPVENIGKKLRLDDGNDNWWRDESGRKKRFGKVNIEKKLREMMPQIRRCDG